MIAWIVMTNGRPDCLQATLASAAQRLEWRFEPPATRLIVDDSGDPEYTKWLEFTFGANWHVTGTPEPLGFCGTIQRAWNELPILESDYIFHLEEDFTFNETIRIGEMIDILADNPKLAQLALLRQAVSPPEIAAGGVIQCYPNDFRQVERNGRIWTEHARFFTTNCSLYPAKITTIPYPQEDFCEGKFTIKLRDEYKYRFAYLGRKNQQPKIEHIGHKRGPKWAWC